MTKETCLCLESPNTRSLAEMDSLNRLLSSFAKRPAPVLMPILDLRYGSFDISRSHLLCT